MRLLQEVLRLKRELIELQKGIETSEDLDALLERATEIAERLKRIRRISEFGRKGEGGN